MKKPITFSTVGAFVWKYYRRRLWAIWAVVLLLTMQAGIELAMPYFMGKMTDVIANASPDNPDAFGQAFEYLFIIAILGVSFHTLAKGTHSFYDWHIKCPAMRDSGIDVFATVQRFSLDWHSNSFSGAVVTKIKRGMNSVERFGDSFYGHFIRTSILMVGIIIFLFIKWPEMGLLFTIGSIFYIILSIKMTTRFIVPNSRSFATSDTALGAQLADAITGNVTVKSFAKENHEDHNFARIAHQWMDNLFGLYVRFNMIDVAQNLLMTILKISLFALVLWLWTQEKASVGDFVFIVGIYALLSGYLRHIGAQVREVQRAASDLEEMVEYSLTPIQIQDAPQAKALQVKKGAITIQNLTFCYPNQKEPVFKNFSIDIKPGEKIALIGHSGSGKSTLIKLIQRFYDLDAGHIKIDGQDIAKVTQESLRKSIALVPQDPILFHRSLIQNIAYANSKSSPQKVISAAKKAYAHEFIKKLTKGYDTMVGERGIKLSGGERQRVAIARAILADTPILALDEATSSLDSESESYIQEALKILVKGRTTLIVAHRLSTIKHVDRILVFDKGKIIEEGSHKDLVKKKGGYYKKLYEMQAGGFIGD